MHFKQALLHKDRHQDPSTGLNPYGTQHRMEEFKLYSNGAAKSDRLIILRYKKV